MRLLITSCGRKASLGNAFLNRRVSLYRVIQSNFLKSLRNCCALAARGNCPRQPSVAKCWRKKVDGAQLCVGESEGRVCFRSLRVC